MTNIDWDNPHHRLALIEQVGATEYSRLLRQHFKNSTVATINGYRIRPIVTRFGTLFQVDGANVAFSTLDQATAHANKLPPAPQGAS